MDIQVKGIATPNTIIYQSGHRINIERGSFLAGDSYRLNPDWRVWNSEGREFVANLYEGFKNYLRTRKYKPLQRISSGYRDAMSCVVANACNGMNRGKPIRYGRGSKDSQMRKECIDYLELECMATNVIGCADEYRKNSSWFYPTERFMLEMERAKIRVGLANNASYLIVRDKDDKPKKFKKNTRDTQKLNRPVSTYNDTWLTHEATLDDKPIIPFCVRIFNESFHYGGRFYRATHMTEPKVNRARIKIDGEATVEPDYKALHFSLLYAWKGIELDTVKDDPYILDDFSRETIKLTSLVLVNSENLAAFKRNVTKSGNPKVKATIEAYEAEYADYLSKICRGMTAKEPFKPLQAEGFIKGMQDGIQGAEILEAIKKRHPLISHYFGAEKIGLKLQRMDSNIMAGCLGALSSLDIPALPVHDSIRCKVSDSETVERIMIDSYRSITGFEPRIDW